MPHTMATTWTTSNASGARVMICDDSVAIRGALARILSADPAINVVARVGNGQQAIDELARQSIDVLVLDIEMPVMDGLTALPLLLRADPGLRVIMSSTLTTRGADIAMQAMRLGAADYVPKPSSIGSTGDESFSRELLEKVKGLARLRRRGSAAAAVSAAAAASPGPASPAPRPPMPSQAGARLSLRPSPALAPRLLAVGSSTGGPQALFTLVQGLGASVRLPVVITQHMPATFMTILAAHLDKLGAMPCAEAQDGEILKPGHIYLAPGDRHMLVQGAGGGQLRARIVADPPENFCRPAVDPMLRSASAACDGRVLVVMLTGMGSDGLLGTRAVVGAGGGAIAQDEASSVVWGMPGAIATAGLCHAVLPLPKIAPKVLDMLRTVPA